jgi:hypothetical protein
MARMLQLSDWEFKTTIKLGVMVYACNFSYSGGGNGRGHCLRPAWAKAQTIFEKQMKSKKTGGIAQMAEHLPSKCDSLN